MGIVFQDIYCVKKINLTTVLPNYKHLLREAVCEVNRRNYSSWMSDQVKTTKLDFKEYEERKTYTSNVVDIIIAALANVTSVKLTVYYVDEETICKHVIQPIDDFQANIELVFVNGHDDFICSSTTARVCVSYSDTSEVDTKSNFEKNLSIAERAQNSAYIEIRSDSDGDNYSDENTIPILIVGNRRYIRETVFDNVEKKNCEQVPEDIDDTCVYIVPLKKIL